MHPSDIRSFNANKIGRAPIDRPSLKYVLSVVLLLGCAGAGFAQTNSGAAANAGARGPEPADDALPEVVVSARKVSERLQDVPMSITALSNETLQQSGAITIADIGREVPGLSVVSTGPGQNQLILRGLSSGGGDAMVGYYIDDTPISASSNIFQTNAMDAALFDLDRVEVLRGPQGTLYGSSSMGGTVRYITNQPDLTATHAAVKATLSGTESGGLNDEIDVLINQPIISGVAAVRADAFFRDYDGYIDRYATNPNNYLAVLPGPVEKNANTEKTYGARVAVDMHPLDSLTVTPSVYYQRTDLGAPFAFDAPPGSFSNPIQSGLVPEPYTDEAELYSLTVQGDVHEVHITSSTSYFDRSIDVVEDDSKVNYFYFSPAPQSYVYPASFDNRFANHNFTEELRAAAGVGPVHGLLGVFYTRDSGSQDFNFPITAGYDAAFGTPFGDQPFYQGHTSLTDDQKAVFSELNWDITSQLEATVGARYFKESRGQAGYTTGVFNGGTSTVNGTSSASGTTPKYGLNYHVTADVLTYATVAKGFREGGVLNALPSICDGDLAHLGLASSPTSYKPDSLWNYELGAKTAWLDRRLTVNGAVYYIDWRNIQQLILLPTCGFDFTGNFGTASSKGAELEIQYEPVNELRFSLGTAFNEAQLTSTVTGAQGQVGSTLENAPKWMGNVSAEYHRDLLRGMSGYGRIDFNTTSHEYNNFDSQSIYYRQAGYSLANLRFGVKKGAWQSSLFVTNLFDKHAEMALPQSYAINLPTTRRESLNRPRTIGLDLRLDY
jgi:iron complex outermembrane recepter protein